MNADLGFLNQLIKSLEDLEAKLEEAYRAEDGEAFNDTKKMMMKICLQIKESIK